MQAYTLRPVWFDELNISPFILVSKLLNSVTKIETKVFYSLALSRVTKSD